MERVEYVAGSLDSGFRRSDGTEAQSRYGSCRDRVRLEIECAVTRGSRVVLEDGSPLAGLLQRHWGSAAEMGADIAG